MPITDINSYDATTAEFEANWNAADAVLDPNPILLAGNYTRFDFIDDRTALLSLINQTRAAQEEERFSYLGLAQKKSALVVRGKQFRGAVLSKITDPQILSELKAVPRVNDEPALFIVPFQAMGRLWERINAGAAGYGLTGPLLLAEGYTLAHFNLDLVAFSNASQATSGAAESASDSKGTRNNAMKAIYERMKQYRAAAPAYLPANSPVLAALPRLSPPPGTTPPPLGAVGVWNISTLKADLSWTATTDATVNRIQIRACTGGTYHGDDEVLVEELAASATSWSGDWGLEAPGAIASFKAVAMTNTGNENGGKAVRVVRPEV